MEYFYRLRVSFTPKSIDSFPSPLITVLSFQTLCPYETVAFGYSAICDLFTYQEWEGFEYSIDLSFAGNNYFQSPTGKAVGIGYVQEFLARIQNHVLTTGGTQANLTLDGNPSTFPTNQTLYFDFSHDTNMAAILTAFNLTQFAPTLPTNGALFTPSTPPPIPLKLANTAPPPRNRHRTLIDSLSSAAFWCPCRHRDHQNPQTSLR